MKRIFKRCQFKYVNVCHQRECVGACVHVCVHACVCLCVSWYYRLVKLLSIKIKLFKIVLVSENYQCCVASYPLVFQLECAMV